MGVKTVKCFSPHPYPFPLLKQMNKINTNLQSLIPHPSPRPLTLPSFGKCSARKPLSIDVRKENTKTKHHPKTQQLSHNGTLAFWRVCFDVLTHWHCYHKYEREKCAGGEIKGVNWRKKATREWSTSSSLDSSAVVDSLADDVLRCLNSSTPVSIPFSTCNRFTQHQRKRGGVVVEGGGGRRRRANTCKHLVSSSSFLFCFVAQHVFGFLKYVYNSWQLQQPIPFTIFQYPAQGK